MAPRAEPAALGHYAVEARPSAIDGLGAFAAEAIPARRRIGSIHGEAISVAEARIRATRHERVMIVEVSTRRALDFHRSTDLLRYTNHSCAPNARLVVRRGQVGIVSLRPIAAGEEICVDYGETHHEGRRRCGCAAPGCRGWL